MEKLSIDLVISDFDGTITQKVIGNQIVPSLISTLRDEGILDEDYSIKAKKLYEKYGAIEKDPNIDKETKNKAMESWWKEHFELLKMKGLKKQHIKEAVNHPNVQIRKGFNEFLEILNKKNIPLIILSSFGLGDESIKQVFKKFNLPLDNVIIISNKLNFDKDGKFVGVGEDKILHSMNKKLKDHLDKYNIDKIVESAKNVLLLGDSLHDPDMTEGIKFNKIYKVGFFLPKEFEKDGDKQVWIKKYDLLLEADESFNKINQII